MNPEHLYSCWIQSVSATGGTPAAEAPTWENLPPIAKQRWTMLAASALNCIAIEMRREHDVAAASISALAFRQHDKYGKVQVLMPRDSAGRPTL